MKIKTILAFICAFALVCTSPPAVAQAPNKVGLEVFVTTKSSFALGGHYNITDLDAARIGPFKIPAGELWGLGTAGSDGLRTGGAVMFPVKLNGQSMIHVGPCATIAPGGGWKYGLALTLEIAIKHNTPTTSGPVIVTIISGPVPLTRRG